MKAPARVKICGITRREDARLAVELGAWALGFVFHPKSPRHVSLEEARAIIEDLGEASVRRVGVFVDAAAEDIQRAVREAGLTTVQLHGDEPARFCSQLGLEVIKAVRPASVADVEALRSYRGLAGILVDAPPVAGSAARGGTGRLADWALARAAKRYGPVILSGGLTPDNVADAIRAVEPFAVDVSSGVEEAPGLKDHDKLARFFEQIRGAENG